MSQDISTNTADLDYKISGSGIRNGSFVQNKSKKKNNTSTTHPLSAASANQKRYNDETSLIFVFPPPSKPPSITSIQDQESALPHSVVFARYLEKWGYYH